MKPKLPLAVIAISLLLSSCSLTRLFREETRRENARIYLHDGTILTGKAVLPDLKDRYMTMFPENGGRIRLSSDEISTAVYWDKEYSDVRNMFVYKEFSGSEFKVKGPFWMKMAGRGKHVDICLCGAYYSFDDKGNITVDASPGDYVYIIGFKSDGKGVLIGNADGSTSSVRSSFVKWLADDPALCRKLLDREIPAKDYEAICEEYSPLSATGQGSEI